MNYAIPVPAAPAIPVAGSDTLFPVHRIFCIGRNYADHAKEMGAAVDRQQPMFFMKPADAIVAGDEVEVRYPSATQDLHHEVEMVVALSKGGADIPRERALDHVFGYGVGLDLTRRDLQAVAKAKSHPWDAAKGFDQSAPVSAIHPASVVGHPKDLRLSLHVNDALRQETRLDDMIFPVDAIIHELSKLWTLAPGDLIYSGTPAGVAALVRGDRFIARLGDIAVLQGRIF
ncbi:fumarylacetoacetate hydrolase family protein [Dokdonella sp.]|uniref:fumarylacetoacetate hydrolase family protein n=1 Tax=Dokdonella sp. TaxID=2291710 RepID=UPI002609D4EE|nr:fumarylacetoacetate hydrolase family protein [Dokdonella sp.]